MNAAKYFRLDFEWDWNLTNIASTPYQKLYNLPPSWTMTGRVICPEGYFLYVEYTFYFFNPTRSSFTGNLRVYNYKNDSDFTLLHRFDFELLREYKQEYLKDHYTKYILSEYYLPWLHLSPTDYNAENYD